MDYLEKEGIQSLIHYPIPPHHQKGYFEFHGLNFRVTEKIHAEVVSLPVSPVMIENEVDAVIDAVNSYRF